MIVHIDSVFTLETLQKDTGSVAGQTEKKNLSPCKTVSSCSRIKGVNGSLPMFQYLHIVLDQILISLIAVDLCV